MYKKFLLLTSLFCVLGSAFVSAQGTISGRVTDKNGEAAIGATVLVVGTRAGAATDFDGNFTINAVPEGTQTIKVTYTGFLENTQTVQVRKGQATKVDIVMQENAKVLDEVVVMGYDVQRKRDIVGSVSKVTSEKLNEVPGGSFENALQGKAAGVQITQSSGIAGAGAVIRVRGMGSLSAGGDPLIVIDNIPIFQNNFTTGESGGQNNNPLNAINPSDIESVEILKDASATAIYGSRGANGVILITTKRGKNGKPEFEFSSRASVSRPTKIRRVLNASEWLQVRQEAWENDGKAGRAPLPNGLTYNDIEGIETDWINEVIGTGLKLDNSLSFKQGTNKLKTYANVSYTNSGSFLIGNTFKRLSGRLNLDYTPVKRVTISLSTSHADGINERIAQAWAGGLGTAQTSALPIYPIYKSNKFDTLSPFYSAEEGQFYNQYSNPVAQRELTDNHVKEYRTFNTLGITYQATNKLTLVLKGNYEYANIAEHTWEDVKWTNSRHITKQKSTFVNNLSGYLTANYDFKLPNENHDLRLLLGTEYQEVDETGADKEYENLATLAYKVSNPLADTLVKLTKDFAYDKSRHLFLSVFGKLTYGYKGKYLGNITVRRDGSSKFGKNSRFGIFPSVGVAYIVSEENFLKNNKTINFLKLKFSTGLSGNSNIPSISQYPVYKYAGGTSGQVYYGDSTRYIEKRPNPDLRWEQNHTYDAGFEIGLWNDRVTAEFTVYNRKSTDVLINTAIPFNSGLPSLNAEYKELSNIATVQNRGMEFNTKIFAYNSRNFTWSFNANVSFNRNKVVDVGNATPDALDGGFGDTRVVVGETFQNNYVVKLLYIDPATGRPVYEAIADDGTRSETFVYDVTNNRQVLGNAQPDFIGGAGTDFRYKNFDFSMLWAFVKGSEIYDDAAKRQLGVVTDWNMFPDIFDRWQKPGDIAKYPRFTMDMQNWGGNANFWQNNHSLWLYDGSYLRLRNISAGYNVPLNSKSVRFLRIGLSAGNLLTFANFPGWDPEIARDRTSDQQRNLGGTNLTYLTPPQEKSFTLSVNLGF